jgi:ABC-2 type transport system permease protein
VLAAVPAVLGGTAGLMVVGSTFRPVPQKDPQWRTGPFDTSDDPNATGAVLGQGYLMLLSTALLAVPGCALVFIGARSGRPVLQAAGIAVGVTLGVLVYWSGGRVAARRLADCGADLMERSTTCAGTRSARPRRASTIAATSVRRAGSATASRIARGARAEIKPATVAVAFAQQPAPRVNLAVAPTSTVAQARDASSAAGRGSDNPRP